MSIPVRQVPGRFHLLYISLYIIVNGYLHNMHRGMLFGRTATRSISGGGTGLLAQNRSTLSTSRKAYAFFSPILARLPTFPSLNTCISSGTLPNGSSHHTKHRAFRTLVTRATSSSGERHRVVFLGTPDVAANSLEQLLNAADAPDATFEVVAVVTQPQRIRGRGKKPSPSPVRERER